MVLNIVTVTLSILGVYGFFNNIFLLTYIGAIAVLIEMLIGLYTNQLKGISTYVISIIIGVLCVHNFFIGASLGLCFDSIITSFIGYVLIFFISKK